MTDTSPYMTPASPYMTLQEAAAWARSDKRTIRRWIEASKLTRYGHGKKVLVRRDQLEALLSEQADSQGAR